MEFLIRFMIEFLTEHEEEYLEWLKIHHPDDPEVAGHE